MIRKAHSLKSLQLFVSEKNLPSRAEVDCRHALGGSHRRRGNDIKTRFNAASFRWPISQTRGIRTQQDIVPRQTQPMKKLTFSLCALIFLAVQTHVEAVAMGC